MQKERKMAWPAEEIYFNDPLPKDPANDRWLWCLSCRSFFQAEHLRLDASGRREACAICGDSGFDELIFAWNSWSSGIEEIPAWWPQSADELHHGLRCDYLTDYEELGEVPVVAIRIWPKDEIESWR